MAQYIDKSALVVEIENIRKHYIEKDFDNGWNFALYKILYFIDTLEVKEVDLTQEIEQALNNLTNKDMRGWFKHFFELGLRSTITEEDCKLIWNIGDEIPNMPEEAFFKELLKRYKAKKGEEV